MIRSHRARGVQLISLITVLVAVVCVLLAGCGVARSESNASGKLRVAVSINQWSSIARDIGGDHVELTTILTNPNVDAHGFEPQVADVAALDTADIEMVNGAGYDEWATRSVRKSGEILVSAAQSAGVHVGQNPHLWFNAHARTMMARNYTAALTRLRPSARQYFDHRYHQWLVREQKLENRMNALRRTTEAGSQPDYVASEAVAWYLARDIGLHDITPTGYTQAIQNDSEPAPSDLASFRHLLASHRARLMILNTQEENSMTRSLETAAQQSRTPIIRLTESMPPRYSDLLTWMNSLVTQFEDAVKS